MNIAPNRPDDDEEDFGVIATVKFYDEKTIPHSSAKVSVHVPRQDSLPDLEAVAIQRAKDFLLQAAQS